MGAIPALRANPDRGFRKDTIVVFLINIRRMVRWMNRLEEHMATLAEAVQGWRDYTAELKAQRDAAVGALDEANTRAQTAADALAAFQADDAATDAQQLADQAQADADFVQGALDEVRNPPAEPPVINEPIDETPVEG